MAEYSNTYLPPEAVAFLRGRYPAITIDPEGRVLHSRENARRVRRAIDQDPSEAVREPLWRLHEEFEAKDPGAHHRALGGVWWLYRAGLQSRWICRGALYYGYGVNAPVIQSALSALREADKGHEGFALCFAESSHGALLGAPGSKASVWTTGKPAQDALQLLRALSGHESLDALEDAFRRIRVPYYRSGMGSV